MRPLLSLLAGLLFLTGGSQLWAEEPANASTPAAAPAATLPPAAPAAHEAAPADAAAPAAPAAEKPKTVEERLTAVEAMAKTGADSVNQVAFNTGDNAWMLTSSVIVLMMTIPGLALFYGGLVRRKNVLGTMYQSFFHCGIVTVIWVLFGFSGTFGPGATTSVPKVDEKGVEVKDDKGVAVMVDQPTAMAGFFGGMDYAMLKNVVWTPESKDDKGVRTPGSIPGPNGDYAASISFGTFFFFQLTFAIITPALICGAFAERMKFAGFAAFTTLWAIFVYIPIAHAVWGKNGFFNWGFNGNMHGAFDFAGGTVVHISSGIAALVVALFIGKRKGYPNSAMPPHSLVLSFVGAAMLWVGWFGFNGGSALSAGALAVLASCNTMIATAAASLSWPLLEWILRGKPTVLGGISGAVAGLVAITPACGFVTPCSALIIGLVAGGLCLVTATYMKRALGYDDTLDAFGVHAIGGIWGAIATGLFFCVDANPGVKALNAGLYDAIVAGTHPVILLQIKAVLITIVISAIGTTIIAAIVKYTIGLRVSAEDEEVGLDLSQHGEEGYVGVG
ncbi:MAG: ammonium transporter [Planctomycetes bacterium]|nr:ammonium transporter [Planctomycetota bacterium]